MEDKKLLEDMKLYIEETEDSESTSNYSDVKEFIKCGTMPDIYYRVLEQIKKEGIK